MLYGVPIVAVPCSTLWITLVTFRRRRAGAAFASGNNAMIQHRVGDDRLAVALWATYLLTWGFTLGSLPMGMLAISASASPPRSPRARSSPRCSRRSYELRSPALREL